MLRLTNACKYAIHAVVYLAARKQGRLVASHHIAQGTGVPDKFLLKVLKPLAQAGILHSLKGPQGGYCLAQPAGNITLLDIIEAVDGPIRGEVAFIDGREPQRLQRRLDPIFDQVARQLRRQLDKTKIAALVRKS